MEDKISNYVAGFRKSYGTQNVRKMLLINKLLIKENIFL